MKHQWKINETSMTNQWKINENQWKINENWSKNEPTHIFHDRFFERQIEPSPKIDPKWTDREPKATKSKQIGTKIWFWSVSFITLVINETLQNSIFDKNDENQWKSMKSMKINEINENHDFPEDSLIFLTIH